MFKKDGLYSDVSNMEMEKIVNFVCYKLRWILYMAC